MGANDQGSSQGDRGILGMMPEEPEEKERLPIKKGNGTGKELDIVVD